MPGAGSGTPIHPPSPLLFLGEDGDGDSLGFYLGAHNLRAPQDLTCGRVVVIPLCAHSLGFVVPGRCRQEQPHILGSRISSREAAPCSLLSEGAGDALL